MIVMKIIMIPTIVYGTQEWTVENAGCELG
jgi:hypothetical protein